jgi:hypothetical protein
LPALSKDITRFHYIVFFIWLALTLIAAIYFISNRLIPFDPNMKLLRVNKISLVKEIKQINKLKNVNLSNTIIHFTSNDCSCTQYSEEHKASINKKVKLDGFNIININLPSDLLTIIPSTPAILILDSKEELLYFGPYSVGLACSESNGYVEAVLQNYAQNYNSDLVISDVKGCYCNI